MSKEKGKLIYEEKDYINNSWKEDALIMYFGPIIALNLFLVVVVFLPLFTGDELRLERSLPVFIFLFFTIDISWIFLYRVGNHGPIFIYENGIDYPCESSSREYRYLPFEEMQAVFFNQTKKAKRNKRNHKRCKHIYGMSLFCFNRDHVLTINRMKKIIPVVQEHLKERWNELISKTELFKDSGYSRAWPFVDKGKEYVYPKEYEWHPEGGGEEEDEETG